MKHIDPAICAALLRGVTDQLHASKAGTSTGNDVASLIRQVKQASAWAYATLKQALLAHYPEIPWSEAEMDLDLQQRAEFAGAYWAYDPIDGAYHYAQDLPLWSSSLVLVSAGRVVLSFVYDPSRQEMFTARTGEGAYLNGIAIHTGTKTALAGAVVGTALPIAASSDGAALPAAVDTLKRVAAQVFVVRMLASASLQLAYVAAGRLDAYWEPGRDIYDWFAGAHLVEEAGGALSDCAGAAFGFGADGIVASSNGLHTALIGLVK